MSQLDILVISLICFGISLVIFVLSYFMFHYLGSDNKLHKQFNKLPQKPFITSLVANLGVILFGASIIFLIVGLVAF